MRGTILALSIAATAAVGCGSGGGAPLPILPADSSSAAKTFFLKNVYPALQLTCAFCHAAPNNPVHAPQWMGFDAATSYANIETFEGLIAYPTNSKILLKGEHTGPALTPTQAKLVQQWLQLEADERGLKAPKPPDMPKPTDPPAVSADEALGQFGKCMSYDDFMTTKAYELAFQQTTGWGPCRGCHNSGWAGAFIDDDSKLMFQQNQHKPFILKLAAFTTQNGAFKDIVPANRFRDKGSEPCTYSGDQKDLCHPKYVLVPEVQDGLDAFFKATYDRWKKTAGKCDAGAGGGGAGGAGGAGGGP